MARRLARVPSGGFFLTNAAVIEDRARQNWPEPYIVSHEPLLWHPTTRQMAFTPPTPPTSRKTRPALLPDDAVTSRSLFRTWPPIALVLSNCLDGCLFSQATTASSGFFFFYLGIPNNFRAHAGIQTKSSRSRAPDLVIIESIDAGHLRTRTVSW